ncbi:MAG: hypothetical protein ACPLVI_07160 [Thermoplasmata archaeon]
MNKIKEIRFSIRLKKYPNLDDIFIAQQHLRHLKTAEDYLKYLLDMDRKNMEMEKTIVK